MLLSIAAIFITGLLSSWLCKKLKFPALFGMILAGIAIGPHGLCLLDSSILSISAELRRIALLIILIRAGLKLELAGLKRVGRPALLLCFLPACFEIAGMLLLAPRLLGLSLLESAILGAVVAAVSPAVVVPRMIRLIDTGYGVKQGIPQMILAGASVDDVFVIVLFTTFTNLAQGAAVSWAGFARIPLSILLGVLAGAAAGTLFELLFRKKPISPPMQALAIFTAALLLDWLGTDFPALPFAGLIAVMAVGSGIRKQNQPMAARLSGIFDQLWMPAEMFLFVLVGASVAVSSLQTAGLGAVLLVLGVLVFRMAGVYCCTISSPLTAREKLFCMLAYTPKATVQAAIGGVPLSMGLPCGATVLTVSVIAILLTAPLGALAIDKTYKNLLTASPPTSPQPTILIRHARFE